jgi:hypothetical protein
MRTQGAGTGRGPGQSSAGEVNGGCRLAVAHVGRQRRRSWSLAVCPAGAARVTGLRSKLETTGAMPTLSLRQGKEKREAIWLPEYLRK